MPYDKNGRRYYRSRASRHAETVDWLFYGCIVVVGGPIVLAMLGLFYMQYGVLGFLVLIAVIVAGFFMPLDH